MKRIYTINIVTTLVALVLFASCKKEDALNPTSIFVDENPANLNALDKYITANITTPYNVDIIYKYVDVESDMNYNLSPADYSSSIRMTRLVQYLGIEPYDVVTGSKSFNRTYFPKILNYIGSPAYRNNGTKVLGTAEGGRKITLYEVNSLTPASATNITFLNDLYFHTIHHEYTHIHNQTKPYPVAFNEVSGAGYIQDSWNTGWANLAAAVSAGFISQYASKEPGEDFAELMSFYVTLTPAAWDARVKLGSAAGQAIIATKIGLVRNYYETAWGINIDNLRDEILKRQADLPTFNQTDI